MLTYGFNMSDGLQLSEDIIDGKVSSGHGRIEFGTNGGGNTSASDHAGRAHGELVLEGAHGNVIVSGPSDRTPWIAHVQSRHEEVDEIVRRDGAHVPLEPAQHQQFPLLEKNKQDGLCQVELLQLGEM